MSTTSTSEVKEPTQGLVSPSGANLYADLLPMLPPYGREFLEMEWGRGVDTYLERLAFVGLANQGRVLDAGGGIGQWAMALARTNREVEVVDLMAERLLVGYTIAQRLGVSNVRFRRESIEALPHADESFDAIICYSVMMFANGPKTAREFARVLRPGGRLYVMIDLWRWYAAQHAKPTTWKRGAVLILKSLLGKSTRFYSPASFEKMLEQAGFSIASHGQDGFATFDPSQEAEAGRFAFYPAQKQGREQLWEVCAMRK